MAVATSGQRSVVGVRDLKNQLSSFLERVKAGEEITVTEHGRPIARLSAIGPDVDRMASLVAAGVIRPAATGRRRVPVRRVPIVGGATSIAHQVSAQRD